MLPIIRTFISLPAGVAKMPFMRFTILTIAGTIPWVLGLAIAGDAVGSNWTSVRKGFTYVDYAVVILVLAAVAWAVTRRIRRGRAEAAGGDDARGGDARGGEAGGGGASALAARADEGTELTAEPPGESDRAATDAAR